MDVLGEVLSHVVSKVFSGWDVSDAKLVLTNAIANPVEAHINGLAAHLFDGVVGESDGRGVVTQYRSPAAVCAPVKRAAYSASAAEATTHGMMDEVVVIVPLMRVGSA